jgi:hypothetical protein
MNSNFAFLLTDRQTDRQTDIYFYLQSGSTVHIHKNNMIYLRQKYNIYTRGSYMQIMV